jgi:hypothetical protein
MARDLREKTVPIFSTATIVFPVLFVDNYLRRRGGVTLVGGGMLGATLGSGSLGIGALAATGFCPITIPL